MSGFLVVIPARYGSSRFPGKPLADIAGKPMIQHVYERACESAADRVVIATDDSRIAEVAVGFGAEVCMTAVEHPSGTDRLQEVSQKLGLAADQIVVNVQGDEPLIPPAIINQVAENLAAHTEASISTLSEAISSSADLFNPNVVKVVSDQQGIALYFSRAPIPWARDSFASLEPNTTPDALPAIPDNFAGWQRHIGIYGYRAAFLDQFVAHPPAALELIECLEQLRAMAIGHRIHVAEAIEKPAAGVDTPEDLERVRRLLG